MIRTENVARSETTRLCLRSRSHAPFSRRWYVQKALERRERQKLPDYAARTRFAPSPTGFLHLGSLRTALFNFLLAKATGGQFLLRVEDTDQRRTVPDSERKLYQDLQWAGLQWDEGPDIGGSYGPYKQSERTELYQTHAKILVHSRNAYRCFCASERAEGGNLGSLCSELSTELSEERASTHEPHVIRLKMPKQEPTYTDLVYGRVRGPPRTKKLLGQACFEDPVLIKSDGFPTYHLANVVDDHHMKVTHVIRATEWMSSTPKHMVMYEAFGWKAPLFAHVGLLQDNEHQKYSKRKGNANLDLRLLKSKGVFPEALINFVALHGWSHDLGDDFLRMNNLIRNFDLKFSKGDTVIVPTKLDYFQKRYAETYAGEGGSHFSEMTERTLEEVERAPTHEDSQIRNRTLICPTAELRPRVTMLLQLEARKYTFPQEFFNRVSYFFYSESHDDQYQLPHPMQEHFKQIKKCFEQVFSDRWNTPYLNEAIQRLAELIGQAENGSSALDTNIIRSCPTIAQTMEILGQKVTLERLAAAEKVLMNKQVSE